MSAAGGALGGAFNLFGGAFNLAGNIVSSIAGKYFLMHLYRKFNSFVKHKSTLLPYGLQFNKGGGNFAPILDRQSLIIMQSLITSN